MPADDLSWPTINENIYGNFNNNNNNNNNIIRSGNNNNNNEVKVLGMKLEKVGLGSVMKEQGDKDDNKGNDNDDNFISGLADDIEKEKGKRGGKKSGKGKEN